MSKIKVNTENGVIEVDIKDVELPEGYSLLEPGKVPDGYFTKEAVQEKINERLKSRDKNIREELQNDNDFQRAILSKFNINLDENGNPTGLKPEFDVEEWKRSKAKELTSPLESKIKELTESQSNLHQKLIANEVLKATSGKFQDQYVKSYVGDEPFVVQKFAPMFGIDEKGVVALKDKEGFDIDGDGSRITPDKFFEMNRDKFADLYKDNRQTGSGFRGGANGSVTFTEEQISKMSDAEYAQNREAILKSQKK